MDGDRDSLARPRRRILPSVAVAGALIALGGHLELIRRFGTSLPFRDQWKCTGEDLLGRWARGELNWRHFFEPLNDHLPVLTRALSFTLAQLNGQWNNLVETTGNALLHAVAVFIFLRLIVPGLGRLAGTGFALASGIVLALPITWENTLWGIQSLVYLQILLSVIYLAAIATRERFDAGWAAGQTAGLLVLLTQHSGVLAEAAAVPLLCWKLFRKDGNRAVVATNLGIALVVIAGFFALVPPMTATASLRADSWQIALDVALRQLAWPIPHPSGALLIYLPWLIFAACQFSRDRLASGDAFILVAGLWVGAQAAAIGYGRGADTTGFVSRYCDFLSLGLLLNGACLIRLWRKARTVSRINLGIFATLWLFAAVQGLWRETRFSHTGYNLERRNAVNAANLSAVADYLTSHDATTLSRASVADTLYTYPPTVKALLDQPGFRALLPPETGAAEARHDRGRLALWLLWLPRIGPGVLAVGVFLIGATWVRQKKAPPPPPDEPDPTSWTLHAIWRSLSGLLGATLILWTLWPGALDFDQKRRWTAAYAPPVTRVEYFDLQLAVADPTQEFSPSAPRRAVATLPIAMRPHWQGTLLEGSLDFHGILRGGDFKVPHHYLFVPVSGWPNWPGNGLRWRFQDPKTKAEQWVSFTGRNPVDGVTVWKLETTSFLGWQAALFLFDGEVGPQGWLGVGRPAASNDGSFDREWLSLIHAERAEETHRLIAMWVVIGFPLWLGLTLTLFRHRWLSRWHRTVDAST